MLTKIPLENLLVETDFTGEGKSPSLELIVEALAKIRGVSVNDLEKKIEENADRFLSSFRA
jgi:Tat protein secretion system quality control protein TatD with DNase activity